jgi:hypothetical protein
VPADAVSSPCQAMAGMEELQLQLRIEQARQATAEAEARTAEARKAEAEARKAEAEARMAEARMAEARKAEAEARKAEAEARKAEVESGKRIILPIKLRFGIQPGNEPIRDPMALWRMAPPASRRLTLLPWLVFPSPGAETSAPASNPVGPSRVRGRGRGLVPLGGIRAAWPASTCVRWVLGACKNCSGRAAQ